MIISDYKLWENLKINIMTINCKKLYQKLCKKKDELKTEE